MKINIGSSDRVIRMVAALIMAALYFTGTVTGTAGIILLVVAAVFAVTSIIGFCGLYQITGINTCPRKK
jgi:hypothetical protein